MRSQGGTAHWACVAGEVIVLVRRPIVGARLFAYHRAHECETAPSNHPVRTPDRDRSPMIAPVEQFREDATRVSPDEEHRRRIQSALGKYYVARDRQVGRFQDWNAARQAAAETKWEAINHLDTLSRGVCDEARGPRREGFLGQQQRGGARLHPRHLPREKGALHRQIEGDDGGGDSPQRGAREGRLRSGGVRPRRIHRAASQGSAVSLRVSRDASVARRDQGAVRARSRQRAERQSRRT